MYDFIMGKLEDISPNGIVIENNGIGYFIITPNPYAFTAKKSTQLKLFVHHYVREDLISLYGFSTQEEKELFLKLLSVTGIGPKGALAVLASGDVQQVVMAIEREDDAYLTRFPGIGKKTARQIVLDLKGKLNSFLENVSPIQATESTELEEAILALRALGYSEKEINRIRPQLRHTKGTTDYFIKEALKLLLKS